VGWARGGEGGGELWVSVGFGCAGPISRTLDPLHSGDAVDMKKITALPGLIAVDGLFIDDLRAQRTLPRARW
jgi:hypothetical protein